MSIGPTQKCYTSLNRQQQIYSDISLIVKLISCFKKEQIVSDKPQNIKNALGVSSLSHINQSSFSNNHSSFSIYEFSNFYPSYKQYGKNFHQLTYSDLLYLLCKKRLLNEFIVEFIQDKYNEKKLQKLHYKVVNNFRTIKQAKQPQISLSQCLNRSWSQILSKEDIFEDAVDLLGWNISKNWRLNNIKIEKKLEKHQMIAKEESRIFQTQPSLQNLSVNPFEMIKGELKSETRKKVIEESTHHILSGLQQLKKEMSECQAEMNMAKNNDERILQKGKQYSQKMREYNQLKQVYRKRTFVKQKFKPNPNFTPNPNLTPSNKRQKKTNAPEDNNNSANRYLNQFMASENDLSKINQEPSEHLDKEQSNINRKDNQPNDFSQLTSIYPNKNEQSIRQNQQKNVKNVAQYVQNSQLSHSVFMPNQKPSQVKSKSTNKNLTSDLFIEKQPLKSHECDELIRILDQVRKNQLRQNRIKTLTNQKDSTPLEKLGRFKKKPLSIDIIHPLRSQQIQQNAQCQQNNTFKSQVIGSSPTKTINKSPTIQMAQTSPKEYLLQKFIKKVFNHYILQQSKMKTIQLFDNSLSGSQLGYDSLISGSVKNKHEIKFIDLSPHLRKKFSVQVNDALKGDSNSNGIMQQRRKKSLSYGIDRSDYNISNKNVSHNNRTKTLANSIAIKKSDPHMTIESYSKFIRAFDLVNKTVPFSDIIKLFKQKSQNKKTIVYDQFVELFEQIYRLQCQKLQVQFTPLLFDAYLRKQVFDWNKINKVLRIKTNDFHTEKGQLRYHNEIPFQSAYKAHFIGHSGMLTEDLVEKINASKKPFTKMPCMNQNSSRFKTLPTNVSQQLPQTKVQQKVQEIKRLRELQKVKKAHQLEQYLREARQKDKTFMTIKDQLKQKTDDSYSVRFKNLQSRRTQAQQKKKHKINIKSSIINETKLKKQFRTDTIGQDQINQKPIKKSIFKNNWEVSDRVLDQDNINQEKVRIQRHRKKTIRKIEEANMPDSNRNSQIKRKNYLHSDKQQEEVQTLENLHKRKEHQDILELQKIIGLRESEDDYEDEYQNQFQHDPDTIKANCPSLNYSQITNLPLSQPSTTMLGKSILSKIQHNTQIPQTQILIKQSKFKPTKQTQQDQYLASYFKKQSFQMDKRNIIQEDESLKGDWLRGHDRQYWRVHF